MVETNIALLIIVLIVILAIVCWSRRKRCHLPCLTGEARDMFLKAMTGNHAARAFEEERSGVSDITHRPERFFAVELREKEHSDVARGARARGGLITGAEMQMWLNENAAEMAAHKDPHY